MVVSREDFPLYSLHIEKLVSQKTALEKQDIFELVMHAALDPVDTMQWQTTNMYLKQVDKFDSLTVHCLILPSNAKLLLLHENESEDKIKNFFNEIYELFVKAILNPFYDPKQKLDIDQFDLRVRSHVKRIF